MLLFICTIITIGKEKDYEKILMADCDIYDIYLYGICRLRRCRCEAFGRASEFPHGGQCSRMGRGAERDGIQVGT